MVLVLPKYNFVISHCVSTLFHIPTSSSEPTKSFTAKEQITISPNPATNYITVSAPMAIAKIEITNMVGQKLISQTPNNRSVDLDISNLVPGIYILKINDSYIKKFVKE